MRLEHGGAAEELFRLFKEPPAKGEEPSGRWERHDTALALLPCLSRGFAT